MPDPATYTARDLAELLQIGVRQSYELIKSGGVPGVVKANNSVRLARGAVDAWLSRDQDRGPLLDQGRHLLVVQAGPLLDRARPHIEALQPILAELSSLISSMGVLDEWLNGTGNGTEDDELTGASPLIIEQEAPPNGHRASP